VPRHVALLRAINLGSTRRIAMGELRELLTAQGYGDVRTHVASGNVLLNSELPPDRLARELEQQIERWFALDVGVVVRSREELAKVVARNPLGALVNDPKRYQVTFLDRELEPLTAGRIVAATIAPEAVAIHGREIYAWHPDGIIRSPLAKALADRRLGVVATARNWNTLTTLVELAS
jgi:uncharacterized protein (DUF1697 family)